jgi:hypothetical protein
VANTLSGGSDAGNLPAGLRRAVAAWRAGAQGQAAAEVGSPALRWGVPLRVEVPIRGGRLQLESIAVLSFQRGSTLHWLGASGALSARAAALAHRFFERASSAFQPAGTVQSLAPHAGRVHAEADGDLAEVEAELTWAAVQQARGQPPARRPIHACRALGCDLIPRCHPRAPPVL